MKYRFRWRANGEDHEAIIEAPDYPIACYKLATHHTRLFIAEGSVPEDMELDLSRPEIVP